MSKYNKLWNYIKKRNEDNQKILFSEIEKILGFKIDHSFLKYKKELTNYGYEVKKISIKENYIFITKKEDNH